MQYIKLNPGKTPYPGAPRPRLSSEDEDEDQDSQTPNQSSQPIGPNEFEEHDRIGLPRVGGHTGLMDIMRSTLVVNPGGGGRESAKKGNMDGAHDSPVHNLSSSNSSLHEPELPIIAHDHDEHIHNDVPALHAHFPPGLPLLDETLLHERTSHHREALPHKTVLKHTHIGLDAEGNLLNFSGKKEHDMHVRIVLPRKEVPRRVDRGYD